MVGSELRNARERVGMTQEQLAHKAPADRSYISEIERGRRSPTVVMFLRLCRAMGVSASAIITRLERHDSRR